MELTKAKYVLGLLRIGMGWMFLWAFLDKTFGLGVATVRDQSWLNGASPTAGFLKNAVHGPFADIYRSMAGSAVVDWLFMIGLLLLGLALIFGIGVKIASYAGGLLMLLMWLSLLPPKNNPIIDEHIIYLFVLLSFAKIKTGHFLGFGARWENTRLVKKYPFLE